MAHRPFRLTRRTALPLAALVALALAAWWWGSHAPSPATGGGAVRDAVVVRRPLVDSLAVNGTIVGDDTVDLAVPFDGAVARVGFAWGDGVTRGQPLIAIDTDELALKVADAESAYLKAVQEAEAVARWDEGVEVARARRAAASARQDLADLDRRVAETRALLTGGLVSRNEYDSLEQQRRGQQAQLAGVREDLDAVRARGGAVERRIATLGRDAAATRLAEIRRQMRRAVVRAPWNGVIVRPPMAAGEAGATALHVGARVSRGQLVGSIARSDALAVAIWLDEADVNALHPGQRATVTGAGFPGITLSGTVAGIAGEASSGSSAGGGPGGGKARFAARIRLDPPRGAPAPPVRIGMSASALVTVYERADAIVAPPEAIVGSAPNAIVRVRRGNAVHDRPVTIGRTTPSGVEILAGLRPGETVVWTPPSPDAVSALP